MIKLIKRLLHRHQWAMNFQRFGGLRFCACGATQKMFGSGVDAEWKNWTPGCLCCSGTGRVAHANANDEIYIETCPNCGGAGDFPFRFRPTDTDS